MPSQTEYWLSQPCSILRGIISSHVMYVCYCSLRRVTHVHNSSHPRKKKPTRGHRRTTKQQGVWNKSPNTNFCAAEQKRNCLLNNYASIKECRNYCNKSYSAVSASWPLSIPEETGVACGAEPGLFIQVQSRRIYRPCGAQIHTILHHTLEKRRFDSWFLAQLDGSYLFSDSSLCFSKPKQ